MKANEAPEKIYLLPRQGGDYAPYWRTDSHHGFGIEYIRTDALIEKACEFLDGSIYDYIELKHANVDTFIDVDNKRFIEDFKNYIKGE